MTASPPTPGKTLAERVQYLFHVRLHPDGRKYTVNEVVAASRGMAAKSNIHDIRNGDNDNPRRETLMCLAVFFKVPITYFYPELDNQEIEPLPGWE